jgi:outer membrane protein TolC
MVITTRIAMAAALLIIPTAAARAQQPLSLRDALEQAGRAGYGNRIAHAQARATASGQLAALRGVLPTVRVEAGYARTTDPIGAFGITMRQRQIEQADFDPNRLNWPNATDNYSGAVVVEAPLINTDAHFGRAAAARAAHAADASANWTAINTATDVVRAYFGAVLAQEQSKTLEAALRAAQAHVKNAELALKAGLVTRSDALLAQVKAGEIETRLMEARGEERVAVRGLAVLMGVPDQADFVLPEALPSTAAVRNALQRLGPSDDIAGRSDIIAAEQAERAARLDVKRATSLYLPRLNAVGRYDWNSASGIYNGVKNWTVGVMATWTPFAGMSEIADRKAAVARASAAVAGVEAARAQAELELMRAGIQRDVALARLDIAERGAQQGTEAHRIVSRKYEGGLAGVVELLEAAATETQTQLSLSHARYTGLIATAEELRARGDDPARLTALLSDDMAGVQ